MRCSEFEVRMQDLLDQRQPPERDAELKQHAEICSGCQDLLNAQAALFRCMGRSAKPVPSDEFASRVVAQVKSSTVAIASPRPRRPWLPAMGVLATAAVALMALSIAMNVRGPASKAPTMNAPSTDHPLAGKGDSAVATHGAPRTQTPALADQDNSQGKGAEAANVESLEQYGQALQSLASQVPLAVERLDEVEEATPGLRPVTSSFTLAIGTIRRTIPPRRQEPPKPGKRDSGFWGLSFVPTV